MCTYEEAAMIAREELLQENAMPTFTTEDADRLLGLADQFLEDWAESVDKDGEDSSDYEERAEEWQKIRPLFEAAPQLLEATKELTQQIQELKGESSCIDEDLLQGVAYNLCIEAIANAQRGK